MPTRLTYWTGTWDPGQEAISKEVELLRSVGATRHPVVSFSSGQRSGVDPGNRVVKLSARRWPVLRALAPMLEWRGDVNHVFGGLDAWHLLRSIGRRPTIFTVVVPGTPVERRLLDRVHVFAVESEALLSDVLKAGVPRERVRLIYPGIDLCEFAPGPPPPRHPFRLLFASSPADPAEFDVRGIPLIVEAARLSPDMEFVLLWREWGDQDAARRTFDRLNPPSNVRLEYRNGRSMATIYRSAHAAVCFYAKGFGKSCPNSIVEALACGVPALVSEACGIAGLIARAGAGMAVTRRAAAIREAARRLRDQHETASRAARLLAEREFGVNRFVNEYHDLYRELNVWNVRQSLRVPEPASRRISCALVTGVRRG